MREIIPFSEVQITSCVFPREIIPFLKVKHFECFNFACAPKLEVVVAWSGHEAYK